MAYTLDAFGNLINDGDEPHALFNTTHNMPCNNDTANFYPSTEQQRTLFQSPNNSNSQTNLVSYLNILEDWLTNGYEKLNLWKETGDSRINNWENDLKEKIGNWKAMMKPNSTFPSSPSPPPFPPPPNMPNPPILPADCSEMMWNEKKREVIKLWQKRKDKIFTLWKCRKDEIYNLWETERNRAKVFRNRI